MTLVAGVDSSTQSCKIVIRDLDTGEVVRQGSAKHPDGTEVNPKFWWDALHAAIEAAGGLADVAAISIGGQQHGMVVLDADGNVIRDALLWNDTRSAAAADEIAAHFGADQIAKLTGSLPVASFTSTKLRWLATAEPENAARVAAVALPHDWLSWRLAGYGPVGESGFGESGFAGESLGPDLSALATDRSDASGTGYFNPVTNAYVPEVLEFALGHVPVLPRVVMPGEVAFTTAGGMLIACGAGDNAAAALGVGASAGDVVVSLGTSGTVFAVSATHTNDPSGTIAGFASASGDALPLVCTLNAARVLDSFCRLFDVTHDELGQLALQAPAGAEGVVLIPFFEGERTPNLPNATAEIHGLRLANNTKPNLARAAIEGMLCGLKGGLDALTDAGVGCSRVFLVGGAANNVAVQRIAGEVFGVPVVVPAAGEYVALGASAQAAQVVIGARPAWSAQVVATIDTPPLPAIADNYARALASVMAQKTS